MSEWLQLEPDYIQIFCFEPDCIEWDLISLIETEVPEGRGWILSDVCIDEMGWHLYENEAYCSKECVERAKNGRKHTTTN